MIKNRCGHHKGNSTEQLLDKKFIINKLDIIPGQIIIDVGCGNGHMAREFSLLTGNMGKVYALDMEPEVIEKLKNKIKAANIIPIITDITKKTGIKDHSIDLIYLSAIFHIFSDEQKKSFLKEIKRLLKPNGKLVIIEIEKKETLFGPPCNMRVSPEEMVQIIKMKLLSLSKVGDYFYMQVFENVDCSYFSM